MAVHLHYYGSVFALSADNDDALWRDIISSYFDQATATGPLTAWFDLLDGGHVSLRIAADTPLGITSS